MAITADVVRLARYLCSFGVGEGELYLYRCRNFKACSKPVDC